MVVAVGDRLEGGFEIGERFDTVDLSGLDQRCDAPPGFVALVMPGEERVFPVQSNRPDQVLDTVRVDLDPPIMKESLQTVPVAVDVGELFSEAGFG